jgi:hypothetical protein
MDVFERINPEMLGQVMNATQKVLTRNSRRGRTLSSVSNVTNASTSDAQDVGETRVNLLCLEIKRHNSQMNLLIAAILKKKEKKPQRGIRKKTKTV